MKVIRVSDLKIGDLFIMDNTEYEVIKIEGGFIYYKTMLSSTLHKNNFISEKSKKFVEKK